MKNLLKNLSNYKLHILFILAVLMVQAYCDLALPRYTQNIIDIGIFNYGYEGAIPEEATQAEMAATQTAYLWSEGSKMLIMSLIMFLASAVVAYSASKVGASIGRDLRSRLFSKVLSYSNAEMDHFSTASLITRCTNDVQQIQLVMTMILRMLLYAPVMAAWGIVNVAGTGASMTWIIVLAVLAVIGFVSLIMSITIPKFKAMQTLVDGLNLVSREILTGLPVIRAFGSEKMEEKRFDDANKALTDTQLFTSRVMSLMQPTMMLMMNGLVVLITWTAASRIDEGSMQIGQMTAFITYSMMIVLSFLMMSFMSIILPRAGVAADRIEEVISTESSITEPEEPEAHDSGNRGEVVFSHVCFRYPGAEEDVLSDIDFTAGAGETTAIIGSTGSGKSTVVNLIPRFYDVTGGSVSVNGIDVRKVKLEDLRSSIGFVPQKGVLFSGTIAENLRFGNEDATDEELKEAADIAQASEFIFDKEEGMERHVSQGGSNVSGGQKQRLAIARALVRKPDILVFDDSFSALDMKTDARLREALEKELRGVTRIIVAQRISTIVKADQIVVLDEGRIAGKGTHRELMKTCRVYREIAESQLSEKELAELSGETAGKAAYRKEAE
ncbi:MAG: ABC transporter ATP-binding protein [Eubacterium sp.]|nr:ABC transporter ATP-binding protein [Eubacterium sp.]